MVQDLHLASLKVLDLESLKPDPRVAKFAPRYKVVFTLLNEDSNKQDPVLQWPIESLIKSEPQASVLGLAASDQY